MPSVNVGFLGTKFLAFPLGAGGWMPVWIASRYAIVVMNGTANDINAGTITFEDADPDPDNVCRPGDFAPMVPIQDCGPIVSGIPNTGNVTVTLSAERNIPAYSSCTFGAPCPRAFIRLGALPAGLTAFGIVEVLRDITPYGPLSGIPPALQLGSGFQAPQGQIAAQPTAARQGAPTPAQTGARHRAREEA